MCVSLICQQKQYLFRSIPLYDKLQEVKVLGNVDVGTVQTEYNARMAMHYIEENHPTLPEVINLDDSDRSEEQ